VEWDEPSEDDEPLPEGPPFAEESVHRELALVALEAAALTRRIFPVPLDRRALSAESRQAVLAIALAHSDAGLSARELSGVLALDMEAAREAIAELIALGMVVRSWLAVEADEDDDSGDVAYTLTERGRTSAAGVALAARSYLPGWPPTHHRS
jgi:hypothetical protein